jgi:hypothetical protein
MVEFLTNDTAVFVYLIATGLSLAAVGVYVVLKFRDFAEDDAPTTSELMTTFRDLHDEGGLTDVEYRTIKSRLAEQMQAELKGNDETGSDDSAAGGAQSWQK